VTTLTLTLLAERFLNSFYDIQDYRSPTRMPTDSGDNGSSDSNNDEFPTISVIAGSIAFVLGLILVLLVTLWFGSKYFSQK